MPFDLQPCLDGRLIRLRPLRADDHGALYAVASDPLIWAQHPNQDRYQRIVFDEFFAKAMGSGGAFAVIEAETGVMIGSSRFYDLDEIGSAVFIGYTFLARRTWGGAYNRELKTLMLGHVFGTLDKALFQVGAENLRSRKAMEKIGARLRSGTPARAVTEPGLRNVTYEILKTNWNAEPKTDQVSPGSA